MTELWRSIQLSLSIALLSTAIVALFGVPLAYLLGRRRFFGRSAIEAVLIAPLVLPPTVVGYGLILLLGVRSPVGALLDRWFGFRFLFSTTAAVLAAVIVSLPLLLIPARAAFAAVEIEFEQTARLMGAGKFDLFWHVNLPLARRGIASGLLLAFARALGEFGATLMVFGAQQGRLTLPISIYQDVASSELRAAAPAVIVLTILALLVVVIYNRFPTSSRRE